MNTDQRARILHEIASGITRRRLLTPARIVLDVVAPVGFLASQVALFVRPFTPLGRWQDYLTALEDEAGWDVLRQLVDRQES